ncbi:MAG: DMT family transporter [Pelagibacteraceae bacterium]|jgi:drug/metabolite transporter (DMT)-like permease|nr:DMT family transporter [Pelagibacteraceae bacterium]MBT4645532.1 DMT family transporter [Pelagibacteraceae bacterium]
MLLYYFIATSAALCWAVASLISADVTRKIGGLAFNRLRLFFVSLMLISYTFYLDTWSTINNDFLFVILLSGIIGIFLGDTLLFIALQKIGPRRNNILFSLAAPFTVILNIIFLNEIMSFVNLIGCIIVFFGVVVAIAYGNSRDKNHRWELVEGNLYLGVIFGIGAALCQAIGLVMMKPILNMGADPIASASLRTLISCIFLAFTFFLNYEIFNTKTSLNLKIIGQSILSGFLGMALGMSLLLIALQHADAGIVATLSSTSPIMILFLIWVVTKKIPTTGAWIGTVLAIIGSVLIFIY